MTEMFDSVGYSGHVASLPAISQALQRALLSWDGLLEWLPVGIYTCDAEGCLVQYNRHAVEIWKSACAALPRPSLPMARNFRLNPRRWQKCSPSASQFVTELTSPSLPISIRYSMTRDASSAA